MSFLRKAGNYNLQEAIAICTKKSLNRALVFLYGKGFISILSLIDLCWIGRAGNGRMALQIILDQLKDIEEAIHFCRETGDQSLWTILIDYSKDKPGTDPKENLDQIFSPSFSIYRWITKSCW